METIHPEETSPAKRFLPPHLLLGAILLSIALDRWLPLARLWQQPWIILGAGIIAAALAVNIFLAIGFLRRKTTVIPFRESTVLITDGLYRFSRNPIYLSMIVLLYGEAIVLGSTASGSMTSIASVSGGPLRDQMKLRSSTITANSGG